MSSRFTRLTMFAVAASVALLSAPPATAKDQPAQLSCAELQNSALAAPADYLERCEGGATQAPAPVDTSFVPGDTVFLCSLFSPNGALARRLLTAPLPTSTYTNVGPCSVAPASIFAMDFDNTATVLWAIDSQCGASCTGTAYGTIDQATGAFTTVGNITGAPSGANFSGMKFDPTDGTVYISTIAGGASQLFRLDLATGAATQIGGNIAGLIIDIGISNTGVIFGHDISLDRIVTIDKVTGAVTPVGPTGIDANFAQGMDFDASDNTLYLFAITIPGNVGRIGSVNLATGQFTQASQNAEELEGAIKRAAGGPCTAPVFTGLTSATSAGTSSCAINLAWSAATACPGTTVKYNVYRSTTPGTPPSAATLLQSCVNALTYTDTTPASGTPYYYIVRAEDDTTTGTGPCNSGVTDSNLTERSATAGGPSATGTDDVENGGSNWRTDGGAGSNLWNIVTTQSNSPTHSWFVADPAVITDQRLTTVSPGNIPAAFVLSFFHRFDTENTFDGHVLEYSLDGGTTWTDILAAQGSVPANLNRFLQGGYNSTISTSFGSPIGGRRAWSNQQLTFAEVRVDMADFVNLNVMIRFRFASDNSVSDVGVWIDDITYRFPGACTTGPTLAAAAEALAVDTAGNGVYQPNETAVVTPTWRNTGTGALTATGALTNHTGPTGPTYTIPDGAGAYTIAVGAAAACTDCYSVANTVTTRPATHWDSSAVETLTPTGATKTWTLHVGDSFTDVAPASPFYRFIETILHKNVTGGCTAAAYCPASTTTREQMAVFVLVSKEPPGYAPVACGAVPQFADVPVTSPFCRWVEELARRGVVSGCGGGNYCPGASATREQMAVFVLRTLDGTLNPPDCTTPMFNDVPASSPFCKWIEELARRGVVTGCGGGNYCPAADVTREQMSVFLAVTFGLTLYGL